MPNVPFITLNNSVTMPQLGLGVFQANEGTEVETAVSAALEAGYRLIDTASYYGNEAGVGQAIAASSIPREELFVTTKLWNNEQGYHNALAAFERSIDKLGLDYLDLYLIHWPTPKQGKIPETWKALEELCAQGRIRTIGVSNFQPVHLEQLLETAQIVPAVNQIELHPRFTQADTRSYCLAHGIQVESWSPIGGSRSGTSLLGESVLENLAEKYGKSPAQIVLRWHIQLGLVVIPKSSHPERIAENIDVFDFELSSTDIADIATLDTATRIGPDPANVN
jgi:2,5-diketo-D-gluconate reductase A